MAWVEGAEGDVDGEFARRWCRGQTGDPGDGEGGLVRVGGQGDDGRGARGRQRFLDALARGTPKAVIAHLNALLNTAYAGYQRALDLLPADDHDHRAAIHDQLGDINSVVENVPQALHHYQEAIQHEEARSNTYGAGRTRYNIALLLRLAGRPGDALHYARAALNNFRDVGIGATSGAQKAQALISRLEQKIGQGAPDN